MKFTPIKLTGSYLVDLEPFCDERGWFARYFCKDEFKAIGHEKEWVQMNHSFTLKSGTLRGMHFQLPPHAEIKLVRCVSGTVFDVIVDIRKDSSTFLQWVGVELSAENGRMIYIPEGFAHGFQCLTDNCSLLYHHTDFYAPGSEKGLRYDDPLLNIQWPLPVSLISERDGQHDWLNNEFKGL